MEVSDYILNYKLVRIVFHTLTYDPPMSLGLNTYIIMTLLDLFKAKYHDNIFWWVILNRSVLQKYTAYILHIILSG